VAQTLRENARKVFEFHDLFKKGNTKDVVWVQEVCSRRYVIITKDKHLLEHGNSLMAWHRNKGKIFYIASGDASAERMCEAILKALREMEQIITNMTGPFYVRILISGGVEIIKPEALPEALRGSVSWIWEPPASTRDT
jgi:predicted nuclease of predicted toxin-antitoxin system